MLGERAPGAPLEYATDFILIYCLLPKQYNLYVDNVLNGVVQDVVNLKITRLITWYIKVPDRQSLTDTILIKFLSCSFPHWRSVNVSRRGITGAYKRYESHYFLTCFRCSIMGFFPLKNIDQKIVISFYWKRVNSKMI